MKILIPLFLSSMALNAYAIEADKLVMEAYSADKHIKFYSCVLEPISVLDCESKIVIDHNGTHEKILSKFEADYLNSLRKEFTYNQTSFIRNRECPAVPYSLENFTLQAVRLDRINPTFYDFKFVLHFNNCSLRPEAESSYFAAINARSLLIYLAK